MEQKKSGELQRAVELTIKVNGKSVVKGKSSSRIDTYIQGGCGGTESHMPPYRE